MAFFVAVVVLAVVDNVAAANGVRRASLAGRLAPPPASTRAAADRPLPLPLPAPVRPSSPAAECPPKRT